MVFSWDILGQVSYHSGSYHTFHLVVVVRYTVTKAIGTLLPSGEQSLPCLALLDRRLFPLVAQVKANISMGFFSVMTVATAAPLSGYSLK